MLGVILTDLSDVLVNVQWHKNYCKVDFKWFFTLYFYHVRRVHVHFLLIAGTYSLGLLVCCLLVAYCSHRLFHSFWRMFTAIALLWWNDEEIMKQPLNSLVSWFLRLVEKVDIKRPTFDIYSFNLILDVWFMNMGRQSRSNIGKVKSCDKCRSCETMLLNVQRIGLFAVI